jgi:hypothetical protein
MKNWIKENGMYVAIVVIVILVILFIVNRARKAKGSSEIKPLKLPKLTRTVTPAPAQEGKSLVQLKRELADCEDSAKSMRLMPGGVHPCANLRDMVAKASGSESNYRNQDPRLRPKPKPPVCRYPNGQVCQCGSPSPCHQYTESNFNGTGPFAKTNGLNVLDFGMGLDGMSLLEDKNLESNYRLISGGATKPRMCRYPTGEPCPCGSDEHCK